MSCGGLEPGTLRGRVLTEDTAWPAAASARRRRVACRAAVYSTQPPRRVASASSHPRRPRNATPPIGVAAPPLQSESLRHPSNRHRPPPSRRAPTSTRGVESKASSGLHKTRMPTVFRPNEGKQVRKGSSSRPPSRGHSPFVSSHADTVQVHWSREPRLPRLSLSLLHRRWIKSSSFKFLVGSDTNRSAKDARIL